MALKAMKTIQPDSYDSDVIQRNTKEFVKQLEDNIILDGILLNDIVITTADTVIEHKLNRKFQGWMIVRKNANADVWESATQTLESKFITLKSDTTVTVSIYIY